MKTFLQKIRGFFTSTVGYAGYAMLFLHFMVMVFSFICLVWMANKPTLMPFNSVELGVNLGVMTLAIINLGYEAYIFWTINKEWTESFHRATVYMYYLTFWGPVLYVVGYFLAFLASGNTNYLWVTVVSFVFWVVSLRWYLMFGKQEQPD